MKKLRVKFVDFWIDMNKPDGTYFYEMLSQRFLVEFSDEPDVLFYSCFGNEYLKYRCTRIFFSPENWRPDFSQCDYAITFDYLDDERHLRLPLWTQYYIYYQRSGMVKKYLEDDPEKRYEQWITRKNFCCIIVSNENAKERIEFYKKLNSKIKVDSAGKWNNTIGGSILPGSENKLEFIKDYRFVISFENSSYPGYTTEKIIEPLLAGCIPIYWGDPKVHLDFDAQRFINIKDVADYDNAINTIIDIENNKYKAKGILSKPIFAGNKEPVYLESDYLSKKLYSWIEESRLHDFKGVGTNTGQRIRYYSALLKSGARALKNKFTRTK